MVVWLKMAKSVLWEGLIVTLFRCFGSFEIFNYWTSWTTLLTTKWPNGSKTMNMCNKSINSSVTDLIIENNHLALRARFLRASKLMQYTIYYLRYELETTVSKL